MHDDRGWIEHLDVPLGSVQRIFSKAGTTRSNHYHKTDAHTLAVVSGAMFYYERLVGSDRTTEVYVGEGQSIFTPPMMEHTTKFPVDTVLLCFSKNPRDQKSYEDDVVRTQDLSALR